VVCGWKIFSNLSTPIIHECTWKSTVYLKINHLIYVEFCGRIFWCDSYCEKYVKLFLLYFNNRLLIVVFLQQWEAVVFVQQILTSVVFLQQCCICATVLDGDRVPSLWNPRIYGIIVWLKTLRSHWLCLNIHGKVFNFNIFHDVSDIFLTFVV